MRVNVVMPKWGMTMTEAVLVAWLISPGDQIAEGESMAVVKT